MLQVDRIIYFAMQLECLDSIDASLSLYCNLKDWISMRYSFHDIESRDTCLPVISYTLKLIRNFEWNKKIYEL